MRVQRRPDPDQGKVNLDRRFGEEGEWTVHVAGPTPRAGDRPVPTFAVLRVIVELISTRPAPLPDSSSVSALKRLPSSRGLPST